MRLKRIKKSIANNLEKKLKSKKMKKMRKQKN